MGWGLELEYAGRSFDLSDQADTQITASFSVFAGTIADISEVSLTLDLGINVPAAIEAGHDLSGATGVLSLDGERIMIGRAVRPVYGAPSEPLGVVRLTLRESFLDDQSLTPGPYEKVDSHTWPQHDPNIRDRVYPQPFGAPGAAVSAPGSPCFLLDTDPVAPQYALVAGFPVEASTVRIHNSTQEWVDTYTVIHTADGRGRQVAVVDVREWQNLIDTGDELWVEWSGGVAISGLAGDVLERFMNFCNVRIDPGRLGAAIQSLNSYSLAGYSDQRVRPMEWIGDNLLPILPISIARDVNGLFPLVYQHAITGEEATAHLEVSPGVCVAAGPITYEGEPMTSYELGYAPRADTGDYLSTATADESTNAFAFAAKARYGSLARDGQYSTKVTTDIVYDPSVAARIVAQHLERKALRARTTTYDLDRSVWGALVRAGRFITITDPARSWLRKPAWVVGRTDTSLGMSIRIMIKDELHRDLR